MTAPTVVGLCACCDKPVYAGQERTETVESGTSARPDVLLHRKTCTRPAVRRYSGGPR